MKTTIILLALLALVDAAGAWPNDAVSLKGRLITNTVPVDDDLIVWDTTTSTFIFTRSPTLLNCTVTNTVTAATTHSKIRNKLSGTGTLLNASTSLVVTLPESAVDATYHVNVTSVDANVGLPAGIRVTARTATQFTLTYTAPAEDVDITYSVEDIP